MSAVDDFLAGVPQPADANGWHTNTADKQVHLTGRVYRYHRYRTDRRQPPDDAWRDDVNDDDIPDADPLWRAE